MPQDFSGFLIKPSTFGGIDNAAAIQERQNEKKAQYDYQNRKDQEQDDYRKAGMLDDVTVENKLTGIPEIDRVYQEQTKRAYNDLVANARKMSFVDLKGEINKRMQPILSGLESAKMDYLNGQKVVNDVAGQIKQVDKAGMVNDLTSRVKMNYINPNGTLKDPNTIHPTDVSDFGNPDYLTKYATGSDALFNAFDPSKGTSHEWSIDIPGGTQNLKAKVPYYIQPSVSRDELMANNLRLPKGKQMTFDVAGESRDIFGNNKPVRLIDKNVAANILNDLPTKVAFNKAFQEAHPEWQKYTASQLEDVQRMFLADFAKTKGFESPQIANTHYFPVTHNTTINQANKEPNIRDVYADVVDKVGDNGITDLRNLIPDNQTTIMKYLKGAGNDGLTSDDVKIEKQGDKYYAVDPSRKEADGSNYRLMPLDKTALNLGANTKDHKTRDKILGGGVTPTLVTVMLPDGRKGQIPSDKVDTFLKENKGAKKQ